MIAHGENVVLNKTVVDGDWHFNSNKSLIPSSNVMLVQLTLTLKMTTTQVVQHQTVTPSLTTVLFTTTLTWMIVILLFHILSCFNIIFAVPLIQANIVFFLLKLV